MGVGGEPWIWLILMSCQLCVNQVEVEDHRVFALMVQNQEVFLFLLAVQSKASFSPFPAVHLSSNVPRTDVSKPEPSFIPVHFQQEIATRV